ncbi:NAD-dependent epimerase/dehydratase family protein [Catellatospora sichuanensis]|uniref:NAD-dependent epimerase/dehydratase family protein n=1 Tax=Catellatospora sichuanensis TaxID=1969805 RepID=UPI00164268BA|nr:NAD-dependent epimerase/dehydratase family protein [Catellatospora sichuanensis]
MNPLPAATRTYVVLGANGGVGSHLVDVLTAANRRVRAVSRAPLPAHRNVEHMSADLRDADQLRAAIDGADIVFHAAQPPYTRWPQEFPALTNDIASATASAGARLVLVDNLYMYGPTTAPMTEDLPYAATDPKGRTRAAMATSLLQRHHAGELDVVLARASDYYGPRGVNSAAGQTLFDAALTGTKANLIGSLDQPHSWSYLPDIADALVRLADAPHSGGRAWHLPAAEPLTQRQLVTLVYQAAGHRPRMAALPGAIHRAIATVHPMLRELYSTRWQFTHPFTTDWTDYATEIAAFTPTPHTQAVRATLTWYSERAGVPARPTEAG